jgi:hypothetical protein
METTLSVPEAPKARSFKMCQLIAYLGCFFELQIAGVLQHQLFEPLDFRAMSFSLMSSTLRPLQGIALQLFGLLARLFAVHPSIRSFTCLTMERGVMPCARLWAICAYAALGFPHRSFHRFGDAVGIQNGAAIEVARGAANGLDQ